MIKSVKFSNYKTLGNYSFHLNEMNVLVGPNNSGKSSILDAFRILYGAYRYSSRLNPKLISLPDGGNSYGYNIPESSIPITLSHIHTDLNDEPTTIIYTLSGNKKLIITFQPKKEPILYFDHPMKSIKTASEYRTEFPINITIVPNIGPLEPEEDQLDEEYVSRWKVSHRTPRMFRNIWFYDQHNFKEFKRILEDSWPGMSISLPEKENLLARKLNMYCLENRLTREIHWSGYGFQVWIQLLTHIVKGQGSDFIIIDEPEIYLHPDLQRKLVFILKQINANIILATHSIEIINEVEPDDVLLIDKTKRYARRMTDNSGIQRVIDILGSTQNIQLTKIARGKKLLFVEGQDVKLLSKFAATLGYNQLFTTGEITVIPVGGFSQWERIFHADWAFSSILGANIKLSALFDRDYRSTDEINGFIQKLQEKIPLVHVLERKEIENYLLIPQAIENTIQKQIKNRVQSSATTEKIDIIEILTLVSEQIKNAVMGQLTAKEFLFRKNSGDDLATIIASGSKKFDELWGNIETRLYIVPGKTILSLLNTYLQSRYNINITYSMIFQNFKKEDIPSEIKGLLSRLEGFRTGLNIMDNTSVIEA